MADKAILERLAIHFGGDDALVSALATKSKIDTTEGVVIKLLDAQLTVWANDEKDVAEIFKLLGLHPTDGKSIGSVVEWRSQNF